MANFKFLFALIAANLVFFGPAEAGHEFTNRFQIRFMGFENPVCKGSPVGRKVHAARKMGDATCHSYKHARFNAFSFMVRWSLPKVPSDGESYIFPVVDGNCRLLIFSEPYCNGEPLYVRNYANALTTYDGWSDCIAVGDQQKNVYGRSVETDCGHAFPML